MLSRTVAFWMTGTGRPVFLSLSCFLKSSNSLPGLGPISGAAQSLIRDPSSMVNGS